MNAYALIMAGGEGTRFYPLSTPEKPKQFLNLYGHASLIQHTFGRVQPIFGDSQIWVATNERFIPLVQEHLPKICLRQLIGEPIKKNTAPCIALAAYLISSVNPEAVMAVFPADHFVADEEQFRKTILKAIEGASDQKKLITFGIRPSWPSAEYGYIRCGASFLEDSFRVVDRFVEKPNSKLAQDYIKEGNYLWNSGIFVWRADAILHEIENYLPRTFNLLQSLSVKNGALSQEDLHRFFNQVESVSIDYGVLERSKNVLVLPVDFRWSDLGSFEALKRLADQKEIELSPEALSHIQRGVR
ncbi:MAG: mannose-1-phosphate guanylyltransferase [Deltaproteobacteria bacterium]|nr:mannose-1-phosphate guanylyltransferase [Deltaproteobacteria bacterium]